MKNPSDKAADLRHAFERIAATVEGESRDRLEAEGQPVLVSQLSQEGLSKLHEIWPKPCPIRPELLKVIDFRFHRPRGAEGCGRFILPGRFSMRAIEESGGVGDDYGVRLAADPAPRRVADELAAILAAEFHRGDLVLDSAVPLYRLHELTGGWGHEADLLSMAWNNSSAFHPRPIRDTGRWSRHCVGAVDFNPRFNPLVLWRGEGATDAQSWTGDDVLAGRLEVSPEASADYAFPRTHPKNPRDLRILGRDASLVQALRGAGWSWGGDWSRLLDRQHFSPGKE